ncbi:hypothetical protein pdam_00012792 [Pocillopora damicornis]|uniref:Mitoguardin n=1 Tax=Pocillopora damicornis TaxID=46731 RepID=A0A3M6TJ53_POCDA|nr:mitoguardin-like isoform X1 [Pocillopora damicornis]RMX41349.1 hypothetical protein pdam_00012792 [Pocillopora damicornis]
MFRSSRLLQITALFALSLGAGTLLFLTARYLKRKRREPSTGKSSSYNDRPLRRKRTFTAGSSKISAAGESSRHTPRSTTSLDNEVVFRRHAANLQSPNAALDDGVLVNDGRVSEDSAIDLGDVITDEEEIVEELIKRGVENFDMALEHWYEATDYVMEWRRPGLSQGGKNSFFLIEADKKLNALISGSRKLRKVIEQYDLMETPLTRTPSNMLTWIDDGSLQEQIPLEFSEDLGDQNSSDADSFVSASDNAQLEFDDITDERLVNESQRLKLFREAVLHTAGSHSHLEFYVSGLQHYIRHGICCRKIRTNEVGCESDMEFLAKVHCVRQASEMVFLSSETRQWFIDAGRQALSAVIESAGKDPSDFQAAFDELVEYSSSAENWGQIKEELNERGVVEISFYDVLLDFVLLDAFDDLATPPYTVATAVQNRWLSARIKETALTTAIWGVLKAKTSYLKDPYGFMAHFYVVAQYVSPVLAWGFLGSDDKLKIVCEYFKSLILDFIRDLFDFTTSDYSSIESLCDSIVRLAKERSEQLLNSDTCETKLLQAAASFDETLIEAPTTPSKEVQKNEEHV